MKAAALPYRQVAVDFFPLLYLLYLPLAQACIHAAPGLVDGIRAFSRPAGPERWKSHGSRELSAP